MIYVASPDVMGHVSGMSGALFAICTDMAPARLLIDGSERVFKSSEGVLL